MEETCITPPETAILAEGIKSEVEKRYPVPRTVLHPSGHADAGRSSALRKRQYTSTKYGLQHFIGATPDALVAVRGCKPTFRVRRETGGETDGRI